MGKIKRYCLNFWTLSTVREWFHRTSPDQFNESVAIRILHSRTFGKLEELSGGNILVHNDLVQRRKVYITSVDNKNGVDAIKHDIMIKILHSANTDQKDIRIIQGPESQRQIEPGRKN